jgi:hypothetical protein
MKSSSKASRFRPAQALMEKSRAPQASKKFRSTVYVDVAKADLPPGAQIKLSLAEAVRLGLVKHSSKRSSYWGRVKRKPKQSLGARKKPAPQPEGQLEQEASISDSAFAPSFRAKAVLKGIEIAKEDLLCSGGTYDLEQVRTLLHGVSRQSIEARVRNGSLLAVPGPSNRRRYPVVQFDGDGKIVEGLSAVQEALPTKNGFAVLNFLIHPDYRLGGRKPIDLLKAGEVELAVEAARRFAEAGA